jgi:hypothetical protein
METMHLTFIVRWSGECLLHTTKACTKNVKHVTGERQPERGGKERNLSRHSDRVLGTFRVMT